MVRRVLNEDPYRNRVTVPCFTDDEMTRRLNLAIDQAWEAATDEQGVNSTLLLCAAAVMLAPAMRSVGQVNQVQLVNSILYANGVEWELVPVTRKPAH